MKKGVRQAICYRTMELHLSNRCMTGYLLSDNGAAIKQQMYNLFVIVLWSCTWSNRCTTDYLLSDYGAALE